MDLWLLPFANIYGMIGYIDGETELDVNLPGITVNVPGIGPVPIVDPATINFDIDIQNEEHWNFLMGGQWEITKRWQITAEGGVGNRRQIVLGSSFRF